MRSEKRRRSIGLTSGSPTICRGASIQHLRSNVIAAADIVPMFAGLFLEREPHLNAGRKITYEHAEQ